MAAACPDIGADLTKLYSQLIEIHPAHLPRGRLSWGAGRTASTGACTAAGGPLGWPPTWTGDGKAMRIGRLGGLPVMLLLGGCTVAHLFDRAERPEPVTVEICDQAYAVFDEAAYRRLFVRSPLTQEIAALRTPCPDFAKHYEADRFGRVARTYLARARPGCELLGSSQVRSWNEYRFTYRCDGDT